eukprot:TRINITY_DN91367_c0_g1_i1.p1 TRINITY_DN91367_c0_g1~~TRINITY_DN91367_c0_g1_i1.p1  ORF type:complete len:275 (+),score=46.85 TRINITY_DN91367_c0_g1_i1:82-906(+)
MLGPAGEPLGKRRRQQVAQLNIGDWSAKKYDIPNEASSAPLAIQELLASSVDAGAAEADAERTEAVECAVAPVNASSTPGAPPSGSSSRRLSALLRLPGAVQSRGRQRRGRRQGLSDSSHSSSDEDCDSSALNPMRLLQERSRAGGRQDHSSRQWDKPVESVEDCLGWGAIGGRKSQVAALKECTLHPLLYPELYKELGLKPPQGVLLHGPPGCGKTLAARALAGACKEAGLPVTFYARRGGDIQSKFVGEAEQRLCDLFEAAKRSAPSIISFR